MPKRTKPQQEIEIESFNLGTLMKSMKKHERHKISIGIYESEGVVVECETCDEELIFIGNPNFDLTPLIYLRSK